MSHLTIKEKREEIRREQKRKWKQKQKLLRPAKELSQSTAAVKKRQQRERLARKKEEESEKRQQAAERKRKSRTALKSKQIQEKSKKEERRRKNTEKQRRWREKKKILTQHNLPLTQEEQQIFQNKMSKSRAIRRLKEALPRTPVKRIATVKAYLSSKKSPTVKELQRRKVVPSPEERKELEMNESVIQDVKSFLNSVKFKRSDKSREAVDILAASVSRPLVQKSRAKVDLARKLGMPVRRISKGVRIRQRVLHSEESSFEFTKRKTRSDKLTEEVQKTVYDFWCLPENSRHTGNKTDVKRVRIAPKTYCSHAIQILEKTQSELFMSFNQHYPEIKISQRTFEKCKPYFVRSARKKDRTTCCCRYHLESKFLFNAFKARRNQLANDGLLDENTCKVYRTISELY
ncbi:reticulocyte-binding protein homolog 2a-like [Saccostrea cucullata]|uniref:reticulocyte-binding protein homolog 2a-like n=1 Tax=Saccostrea cuccullata TaxID=36930 RepID=UPI002ED12188